MLCLSGQDGVCNLALLISSLLATLCHLVSMSVHRTPVRSLLRDAGKNPRQVQTMPFYLK